MAKYLDDNGLLYFWQKIKTIFATQSALNTLSGRVDDIVAEGGEPNTIDTVKVNGAALTPDAQKAVNITITEGTDNGTIKVNGTDVEVHGLGNAAFTSSGAYDSAGSAAAVQNNVDTLSALVGSTAVATQIQNAINALDSSASAAAAAPAAPVNLAAGETIAAPMPGNILRVDVNQGDVVKAGQILVVLEAMKMENEIVAPKDGTVAQVVTSKGAVVDTGAPLVIIA